MLPAAHRLRRSADFTAVMRRGRRYGAEVIVVHALPGGSPTADCTRFGLIVSKAVGGSVVRHRVSRRLRAVLAERLDTFPAGCDVVVRALPISATAPSSTLAVAVDRAARRMTDTVGAPGRAGGTAVRP